MSTILNSRTTAKTQTRFKLHRLELDDHVAYNAEFNSKIKPYLPISLRRKVFDTVHQLPHKSGRTVYKDVLQWAKQRSKVLGHNRTEFRNFKLLTLAPTSSNLVLVKAMGVTLLLLIYIHVGHKQFQS